jgi:N-acetylglucosamine kinase-like BadF-type ATPase
VGVSVVVGVDGGNTKTDLVVASIEGEVLASVRGPGSNSHAPGGAAGSVEVIASLVEQAELNGRGEHGAFFLCGADSPDDIVGLSQEIAQRGWVRAATVDNDTFAILRAGPDRGDAVAVVCGSGINCVGRSAAGRVARYPSLGWETGDWGGGDALAREALFLAARAEDGRGEPTELGHLVRRHFGAERVEDVGADFHYQRLPQSRLGELAPLVVAAAERDAVAAGLVDRLAEEVVLMVRRAFRDLAVELADVVLGGGMLAGGEGLLHERIVARLPSVANPVVLREPPVLGAALAALDAAGATDDAKRRLRAELHAR